jgi:hypothetical protein
MLQSLRNQVVADNVMQDWGLSQQSGSPLKLITTILTA